MPDTVEVSRSYAGQLGVDFGEGPFDGKPSSNVKDIILNELTEILGELNDQFKRIACECLRTCFKKKHTTQELMFTFNHWSSKILTQ